MSLHRLSGYLTKIQRNDPINLPKFSSVIDKLVLSSGYSSKDISARKHGGDLYIDVRIPSALLEELTLLATGLGGTRIEAARQNRSHSVKVNGSIIIMRKGEELPFVVMIDNHGMAISPSSQSQIALLIENRQNFINITTTLRFLIQKTSFEHFPSMDIILCDGNQITNSLHKTFLSHYSYLYLFLDFDLGGLCIADGISKLLPEIEYKYLVPDDIQTRLNNVVELQSHQYIDDVIQLGVMNNDLAPYAKLMRDNRKVIEQEGYLYE